MYSLGFETQLVARSSACDFPPEARALPVAGDFGRPNLEAIERLQPSLMIVTDVENPASLRALRQTGVKCMELSCEGWSNLLAAARAIGRELGDPERADRWVASMSARREAIKQRSDNTWNDRTRPRIYVEIWKEPLTTAGHSSFLGDLVTLAGGQNIAATLPEKYPHVSSEWVIRENPDAIVLLYMLEQGNDPVADVKKRTGWGGIRAVRTGAISANIRPDLLLRSGPRCLDGADKLAEFLRGL